MTFKETRIYQIILFSIAAIMVVMGILIFITPPSIFPDPSWGFQVMRSMQMGGKFNMIPNLDPADISKNISSFLSWWSPGQYLTPYFLKTITGLNTGRAAALTVILGNLSGLAGFYFFFKKAGFSKMVAAVSLLFILIQQAFWVPYAYYNGGEILLFAFEGWFLLGCISFNKVDLKLLVFILCSGWIGFFCKSSFMWIYASGLLCLWIRLSKGESNWFGWIKKGTWLAVPAILSLAVIYLVYLSKGENPASASGGFKLAFEALGFPLASPLLAGFSVDDMLNGLIFGSDPQQFTYTQTVFILLTLAILSVLLIILLLRYVPHNNYRLLIIVFYSVSILFFGYSFLKQAAISYESRHFRTMGLLIVPGVIYLVSRSKLPYQAAFIIICGAIAYKSSKYMALINRVNQNGAHGITGLSQQFIDQPSLNYMLSLDQQKTNAVFVFTSADIGLEIQHHRIITLDPYDKSTEQNIAPYNGHAGIIYLVLPSSYKSKEVSVMFKYFPGYKDFIPTRLSKNYVLYTAQ
jgi:hypothetical protein